MKADLIFYIETYGGDCKIPAEKFPLWEKRADAALKQIIGNAEYSAEFDDCVKMCICEIAEYLYEEDRHGGIASEGNDGYSVRYENGDIKTKISAIVSMWLSGTDMLYRGVYNGK